MGGQQSSEHHMHRLLIRANEPTSWISAFLQGALSQVYDAVEIALNPAALILKQKSSSQDMAQGAKFTTDYN